MLDGIDNWIWGRKSLSELISDADSLLQRPAERLRAQAVGIPGASAWRLALLLVVLVPVAVVILTGRVDFALYGLGGAVLLGLGAVWGLAGNALELTADALVYVRGEVRVSMPWALFNHHGTALIQQGVGVSFPINPAFASGIVARDGLRLLGQSEKLPLRYRFVKGETLELPWQFRLDVHEGANLIQTLGRQLAAETAVESETAPTQADQPALDDSKNTVVLSVHQLAFPEICCGCGVETDHFVETEARMLGAWSLLLRFDLTVDFSIWYCEPCYQSGRKTTKRSTLIGLAIGTVLGTLGSLLTYGSLPGWMGFLVLGLLLGPLFGWLIGGWLAQPLKSARYNPFKKTVKLRFRHPGYARLVAE